MEEYEVDNQEGQDEIDIAFQREEALENQQDAQEAFYEERAGGDLQGKEDIWSLFWKVVKTDDTSKIGNLRKEELGILPFTVRDCQFIALKAITLKRYGFASFFQAIAESNLATSLSRDGEFLKTIVTQRREVERKKSDPQLAQLRQQNIEQSKRRGFMK